MTLIEQAIKAEQEYQLQMREQVEQMNDQMNILKAEIIATQEEAEELKRLSERK